MNITPELMKKITDEIRSKARYGEELCFNVHVVGDTVHWKEEDYEDLYFRTAPLASLDCMKG